MPSNHLILWGPLFLLPSIFLSIMVFSSESTLCIMWAKYFYFGFLSRMQVWLSYVGMIVTHLKDLFFILSVSPRTPEVPLPDRICHCLHGWHSATKVWSHWGADANDTLAEKPARPDSHPWRLPCGRLALRSLADQSTSTGGHWNLSMLSPESSQLKNRKWSRSQNLIRYFSVLYFRQNYVF